MRIGNWKLEIGNLITLVVGINLVVISMPVYAQDEYTGITSANFLKLDVGARQAAMAGAFVGVADDVNTINYNPAGLVQAGTISLTAMHNQWLQSIKYEYLGYAQRMWWDGVIGGSLAYLHMGDIPGSRFSPGGGYEKADDFTAYDACLTFSYAQPWSDGLSIGANFKIIYEKIEKENASTIAFDLGAFYKTPIDNLSFGLCLQNLGSGLKFIKEKSDLPMNLKGGVSAKLLDERLLIALDANKPIDNKINGRLGFEYWLIDTFAIRAGYRTDVDIGSGFSGGIGLKLMNYQIDYGFAPYDELGDTHRISLRMDFLPE
ncbi:MAG: PorV/PorQ family protein [bacterium]|nr:PorV/PorQ family protein [bacterium]